MTELTRNNILIRFEEEKGIRTMSTNDTKAPLVGGKIEGRAKQVDGRLTELDGKTFDDPVEQLDGMAEVVAGRVEEAVGKAEGDVIAAAEKESYQGIREGRAERLEGATREAAGKVKAGWGRMTGQPDTEIKGIAEQVDGAAEKAVGSATEDTAKGTFGDALKTDLDYVTGND